jgi:hypothetical protein
MLPVFYIDVAKVDRDVAHVAITIYVCFKCMFQIFHMFQMYVASVSFGCCRSKYGSCIYMHVASICFKCFTCFTLMLQLFHLNVAYVFAMATHVFSSFLWCFASVSDICCKCFGCFRTYVASVSSRC